MSLCLGLLQACMIDSSHVTLEFKLPQLYTKCSCLDKPGQFVIFVFILSMHAQGKHSIFIPILIPNEPIREHGWDTLRWSGQRLWGKRTTHGYNSSALPTFPLAMWCKAAAVIFSPTAEATSRAQITKWIPPSAANLLALSLTSPLSRLPNQHQTHQGKS